jgi:transcriptional regulator with XRE-family HTH domain
LKEKRLEKGLTQMDMLRALGKDDAWFTAWSAIETGQRNLPPALWEDTMKILGIPKDEFIDVIIRYTNPWLYGLMYGFDPNLRAELSAIPEHYTDLVPSRRRRSSGATPSRATRQ